MITSLVTNDSPIWQTKVQVADADYAIPVFSGIMLAYTSITASRTVTLPAATTNGQIVQVVDESGSCSASVIINIVPSGTDTIENATAKQINYPYGTFKLESNGSGKWVVITNPNPNLSAGIISQPTYTDLGTGSVTIGAGTYALFSDPNGVGKIKTYTLAGGTFALTDGVTNYMIINYNSGSPAIQVVTDVTVINETTIIPLFTIYRRGTDLHPFEWDQLGDALTNKIHKSIVKTQRYRAEPGSLGLGEAATRIITIGTGTVWTGAVPTALASVRSDTSVLYFLYHAAGVWTLDTSTTQYNNTQYDDGTNLQTLPGGKYAVNFVYRSIGQDTDIAIVLGGGAYSLGQAQASQPPGSLPQIITSHMMLVGRIIVQQGGSTATQIDSALTTLFTPTPALDHNSLANLQGGTASQYYHLTSAEYSGTGTGNFVRLNGPALTGTPTTPTQALSDNSTTIVNSAWVKGQGYVTSALSNPMTSVGDIIVGSTAGAPARLGIGTSGYFLRVSAGTPAWVTLSSSDVTAALGYTPGAGTVTTVSVVSANGFTGSVANPTTTPAITLTTSITGLLKGNGTAISAAGSSDVTTALGFTPVNKAGDTGVGNISMGVLTASSIVISGNSNYIKTNTSEFLNFYSTTSKGAYSGTTSWFINNNTDTVRLFTITNAGAATFAGSVAAGSLTSTTGNFSDTAASTSTSTGSVILAGGMGVAGNSYFGGVIHFTNATASTSTTTGAVIITGGLGVGAQIAADSGVFASSITASNVSAYVRLGSGAGNHADFTQDSSDGFGTTIVTNPSGVGDAKVAAFIGDGSTSNQKNRIKIFNMTGGSSGLGTPSGGGYLFVESGALKYKGSSGTVTTIAPA